MQKNANVSFVLSQEQLLALEYLMQNINWEDLLHLSSDEEQILLMRGGLALLRLALTDAKKQSAH